MPRDRFARQSLGVLHGKIKQSRVLMVGAGGIGCELLKNLVLTGFGEIHIVDLDTIDLSNLNRQFLFRHEHIKRPKALVAKESAGKFNPNVKIEAHHANIKDPSYNVDFFSSFAIVFNALDNLDARRHVNRMCLAANVPLIESGTTGFNGQVQVIKRGLSECYDCNPKEIPKSFPVCTIRSTPSQPIHCIVWAKSYLFAEIFGTSEDDAPDLDTTQDSENAEEIEKLRTEAQALKRIRDSMGSEDFPRRVFEKVFIDDIDRLRSMEDMWRTRKKPTPLDYEKLSEQAKDVETAITEEDQKTWSPAENLAVFTQSMKRLSNRLEAARANPDTGNSTVVLSFDKDDKDCLDFVAASANLRSIVFAIEPKSEFEIKQMAGNIIPAIATTNAMTASLCVLQSFHVLRETYHRARMLFLVRSVDRCISSEPLSAPNPHCVVCGVAHVRVEVDLATATLRNLVEDVLKGSLAYGDELSVTVDGTGLVFDPDLDDNLDKPLRDLGVKQDGFLTIVDEDDDEPRVNLVLTVKERSATEEKPETPIRLLEKFEIKKKPAKPVEEPVKSNADNQTDVIITNGSSTGEKRTADEADLNGNGVGSGKKRKHSKESDRPAADDDVRKKGRVMEERPAPGVVNGDGKHNVEAEQSNGAVVVEDDPGNGEIVIDD